MLTPIVNQLYARIDRIPGRQGLRGVNIAFLQTQTLDPQPPLGRIGERVTQQLKTLC